MIKYKLTDKTQGWHGDLYRVVRLSDNLKGGWIEDEANLSHLGDCFVYGEAEVFGHASVSGNAQIHGKSRVSGFSLVCQEAKIYDSASIGGIARVSGNAIIFGNASICEKAEVFGDAYIGGNVTVQDRARIFGETHLVGTAVIGSTTEIKDSYQVRHIQHVVRGINMTLTPTHTCIGTDIKPNSEWLSPTVFSTWLKEQEFKTDGIFLDKKGIAFLRKTLKLFINVE